MCPIPCLITWNTTVVNKRWSDLLLIKMQSDLLSVCCWVDWTWCDTEVEKLPVTHLFPHRQAHHCCFTLSICSRMVFTGPLIRQFLHFHFWSFGTFCNKGTDFLISGCLLSVRNTLSRNAKRGILGWRLPGLLKTTTSTTMAVTFKESGGKRT